MNRVLSTTMARAMMLSLLAFLTAISAPAEPHKRLNVAIFVFPGVQTIDYAGPMEVFSQAGGNVFAVAEKPEPIVTSSGLSIVPKYVFGNAPQADIFVIPGGGGANPGEGGVGDQTADVTAIRWIKDTARSTSNVLTVCNGAFLAAKAGLLDGLKATTFYGMLDDLEVAAPRTKVMRDQRYVDNGKVITTAGLSSGIDGALYLVSKLQGLAKAQSIALHMEYNWDPKSNYARGSLADLNMPRISLDKILENLELVSMHGDRNQWGDVFRGTWKCSSEQLLARIDDAISVSTQWSRVNESHGNATSVWHFQDKSGQDWKGVLQIARDTSNPGKVLVTATIQKVYELL